MSEDWTFEFKHEEDGAAIDCASCGYPAPLREFGLKPDRSLKVQLCELCSSTLAYRAVEYPTHYVESGPAMQVTCYVGNAILAELRALKESMATATGCDCRECQR